MIVIVSVEFKQGCLWRQESFPVVKFMNCRYSVPKQGQRTCVSIIDNNLWCFCFYLVNKTCKSVQLLRFVLNWLWYAKAECKISGKRLGCYVTRPQLVPGLEEDQYTICELPCACYKTSPCAKHFIWREVWFARAQACRQNTYSHGFVRTPFDAEAKGNLWTAYQLVNIFLSRIKGAK